MSRSKDFFKILCLEAALITYPSNSNYSFDVQTSVSEGLFTPSLASPFTPSLASLHQRGIFTPSEGQLSHLPGGSQAVIKHQHIN